MKSSYIIAAIAGLFAIGCSSVSPEQSRSRLVADRPLVSTSTTIPGFTQTFTTTKFQTGGSVSNQTAGVFTKWVGSDGVFAIAGDNGAAKGVMNAGVPFTPYAGTESDHEALVRSYFVGAGLPAGQIGPMHTNFTANGDGAPGTPEVVKSVWFSSIVTRTAGGISVAESHAWARLDVSGNVVAEDVYWPPLDSSVVSDAVALAQTVGDAASALTYLGKLPFASSVSSAGSVVIHHTSEFVRGGSSTFQDFASFDVWNASPMGSGWVRHFDKNGNELHTPQELRQGAHVTTTR
jgi:hypothetical protein